MHRARVVLGSERCVARENVVRIGRREWTRTIDIFPVKTSTDFDPSNKSLGQRPNITLPVYAQNPRSQGGDEVPKFICMITQ